MLPGIKSSSQFKARLLMLYEWKSNGYDSNFRRYMVQMNEAGYVHTESL